jgi:histidyl-tRNA synthetase
MAELIQPRTLKGFRDYLPEAMIPREKLMETARKVYRSFGYSPIDTPALELLEILTGKGSDETDRQMYRFEDNGGRQVGMRFDLTVPLARFVAQHIGNLGTPFKRYHLGTVWRGENTQDGRYREFMQCDFDTIGTKSVVADTETGVVIHELLLAIGIEDFTVRINNRKLLTGFLESAGLKENATPVLRALDKLEKIGAEKVLAEMEQTAAVKPEAGKQIIALAEISGSHDEVLQQAESLAKTELAQEGVSELAAVVSGMRSAGVTESRMKLDLGIARGLDYYTGTIFETTLNNLPKIGSVCSGGRYDNLAGLYTKQELPGIGASLGLDRLLTAMEKLGMVESIRTPAEVLVVFFAESHRDDYVKLAMQLRRSGIGAELYPDAKKMGQQLKYADRNGFPFAVIVGDQEWEDGVAQLKDMASGESQTCSLAENASELIAEIQKKVNKNSLV